MSILKIKRAKKCVNPLKMEKLEKKTAMEMILTLLKIKVFSCQVTHVFF